MLTDQQTLRAAFEPLNGENIHVHLVCAQKQSEGKKPDNSSGRLTSQSQMSPGSTSSGGSINQPSSSHVVTGSTIPNLNHQQTPFANPSLVPGMFPIFGTIPGGAVSGGAGGAVTPMMWTPEQMAHMQQMYTQFLAQYNLQPTVPPATVPLPFPQHLNANVNTNEPLNPPPVPPVVPGVGAPDQPNPMRLEPEDDDDENRDWLDLFYWLSRAVVLFSVVYFYSSFTRFILVVGIAILMYLHQIGFIFPGNNRPAAPRRPGENRQDRDSDGNDESDDPNDPVQVPETTSETERCSGLRLFWVIVSSLFTSLIPETQAPVNFN